MSKPFAVSGEQFVRAIQEYQAHALNRTAESTYEVQQREKYYAMQVERAGVGGKNAKNKRGIRNWKPAVEYVDGPAPPLANPKKLPKGLHWRCKNPNCHCCEPDGGMVGVRCPHCGKNREPIMGRKGRKPKIVHWTPTMFPRVVKVFETSQRRASRKWEEKNKAKRQKYNREWYARKQAEKVKEQT